MATYNNMQSPQKTNVERKNDFQKDPYSIVTYSFKIHKNMLYIYGGLDLYKKYFKKSITWDKPNS